jgi:predicted DNA-binding protein
MKQTETKLIRMNVELKEAIKQAADKKGISESDLIRIAIEKETKSILEGDIQTQLNLL